VWQRDQIGVPRAAVAAYQCDRPGLELDPGGVFVQKLAEPTGRDLTRRAEDFGMVAEPQARTAVPVLGPAGRGAVAAAQMQRAGGTDQPQDG
jgi:hypothetical protein